MKINSKRLQNWNYSWARTYLITINCKYKAKFFGEVIDCKMTCSKLGIIAQQIWSMIPQKFPYVQLGEFQIMPDHVHGIVIFPKREEESGKRNIPKGAGGITGDNNPMFYEKLSRVTR